MTVKDENYYRRQAARKNRIIIIFGILAIITAGIVILVRNTFYDFCTNSYDRSPAGVIQSYISAIENGNGNTVRRCWDRTTYYEVSSGCSEICVSRLYGTDYEIESMDLTGSQFVDNRSRITATLDISCPSSGETHKSKIVLDSIQQDFSWKHWKILESDFGGPISDPWCQPD